MLELKNITKVYPAGGDPVHALKGVSLQFRDCEFVSILGPSGCGKTTLLNIIGGLDGYTDGDLRINGVSTKEYSDRDWDAYRNHSIGFVFQSYNLIPHQTVLQNVELALTLSGVSKHERKIRAKQALERVGLGDQFRKKPSEMSGGQMQRVAIARAIVNNPDIILADEPTGALDTETGIQVMQILKELARDRLVIMVTHNPELADIYSTRIVHMLDGLLQDDSMPVTGAEMTELQKKHEKNHTQSRATKKKQDKKPSMSWFTSFGLSLKNLISKKGRTALTSFAGSIGIIGIALIYAVSQGTTDYIDAVQEDTLSSYPLTLEAQSVSLSTLIETFTGKAESIETHENDAVYQKAMLYELVNAYNSIEAKENDLAAFKTYLESAKNDENNALSKALSGIHYSYGFDMMVYTKNDIDGSIMLSDSSALMNEVFKEVYGIDLSSATSSSAMSSYSSLASSSMSSSSMWEEMLPGDNGKLVNDLIESQYDVIYGSLPTSYNQIVLVVDANNEIDDLTLYALGLKSKEEIISVTEEAMNGNVVEYELKHWSYEEICNMEFRVVLNSDCYYYDEEEGVLKDYRDTDIGLQYLYDELSIPLQVSGIIRPNPDATATMLSGQIAYTSALSEYLIERINESDNVVKQKASPDTDLFTGLPFKSQNITTDAQKAEAFQNYIATLTTAQKAEMYRNIASAPTDSEVETQVNSTMAMLTTRQALLAAIQMAAPEQYQQMSATIGQMSDEQLFSAFEGMLEKSLPEQIQAKKYQQLSLQDDATCVGQLETLIDASDEATLASYYDNYMTEFSDSTLEGNLQALGCVDMDRPTSISLYASSFADKDVIKDAIEEYNDAQEDEVKKIEYTDYVGLIMSSVTTIINAITYVLIAFVSVSLIVSSIMIGVITLISVQERTKEIGILRAIGASKKNVSGLFNAETVMIGLMSGVIGVLVTYLLCIPINLILHHLTNINTLSAKLPWQVALTLIAISVLMTLIAGIIPSRSAAKKDPVVALRTE